MARARRSFAGELAAWHLAQLVARLPFTAEALVPDQINPYRIEKTPTATLAEIEWRNKRRMWRGLVQGFIDAANARKRS